MRAKKTSLFQIAQSWWWRFWPMAALFSGGSLGFSLVSFPNPFGPNPLSQNPLEIRSTQPIEVREQSSTESAWNKYFSGKPGFFHLQGEYALSEQEKEDIFLSSVRKLLSSPPIRCERDRDQIIRLLWRYRNRITQRDWENPDKAYDAIQAVLKTYSPGTDCYISNMNAYFLGSLHLHSMGYNGGAHTTQIATGAFMILRGLIKPLLSGCSSMFGAYSCTDSTSYLDPTLHPYDLGGVFAHEILHFFHDKAFVGLEPLKMSSKDWKAYLVFEESLAATLVASSQLELTEMTAAWAFGQDIRFNPYSGPALSQKDLRLFSLQGAILEEKNRKSFRNSETDLESWLSYVNVTNREGQKKIFEKTADAYFSLIPSSVDNLMEIFLPRFINETSITHRPFHGRVPMDFENFMTFLERVSVKTSPVCRHFHEAANQGKLTDYAGFTNTGTLLRCGGEGTKPSLKLVRPCLRLDKI